MQNTSIAIIFSVPLDYPKLNKPLLTLFLVIALITGITTIGLTLFSNNAFALDSKLTDVLKKNCLTSYTPKSCLKLIHPISPPHVQSSILIVTAVSHAQVGGIVTVHGTSNGIPQSFEFTEDSRHPVIRSFEMKAGEPFVVYIELEGHSHLILLNVHGKICDARLIAGNNLWECKGQNSNGPQSVIFDFESRF